MKRVVLIELPIWIQAIAADAPEQFFQIRHCDAGVEQNAHAFDIRCLESPRLRGAFGSEMQWRPVSIVDGVRLRVDIGPRLYARKNRRENEGARGQRDDEAKARTREDEKASWR